MPNLNEFSMDYRPESYWGCYQEGFTNIKGEMRRKTLGNVLVSGLLGLLPGSLLSDKLPDEERQSIGAIHPSFMGGEYLPDYLTGELEIARVSLQSVTWDVVSIRAQELGNGRISYRVVDEHESTLRCWPATSANPLTMGELISLMDGVERYDDGCEDDCGLTDYYRDFNYLCDKSLEYLDMLVNFVQVSSMYYPELEQWYEKEAQKWYVKRLAELTIESGRE